MASARPDCRAATALGIQGVEMGWLITIVVGGIAGWIASMLMRSDTGVVMNVLLGIIGAAVARFLFGLVGVSFAGMTGYLVAGVLGACILVGGARMIR